MTNLKLLFLLGRPFSPIYSFVMSARALFYKKRVFTTHYLPVPVVSVGNLTMGGTGKTPMVAMIAKSLREKGYRPAVISRGYGGTAADPVNIVSDGEKLLLDVTAAGDEPTMLSSILPGVPVLTGKKRIHPCRYAIENLHADCIVLDDGFQHLSINRDINIVLFNATSLAGNSRVFPGGDLREPVKALHRADIFALTGVDEQNKERAKSFQEILHSKFPDIPVCFTKYSEPKVHDSNDSVVHLSDIPTPLFAFSGIAHPSRFFATLNSIGLEPAQCHGFKDHVHYKDKEKQKIRNISASCRANGLITTLKDKVKLTSYDFDVPLFHLVFETEAAEPFMKLILDRIEGFKPPGKT